jgi:hypothetical protein
MTHAAAITGRYYQSPLAPLFGRPAVMSANMRKEAPGPDSQPR